MYTSARAYAHQQGGLSMCIIAGYAGNKPAAPILIEMLKKTEYIDGGLSTGIATIHEGKLYMRKVIGDVDTLLRETDALDLPGTTGIIHSRTGGNFVEHAHPFLSDDGKMAAVLNGTDWGGGNADFYAEERRIMNEFFEKGIKTRSAVPDPTPEKPKQLVLKNGHMFHVSEPFVLKIGEKIRNSKKEDLPRDIAKATKEALEDLPIDIILAAVHEDIPDTITVGTVTRPMAIALGDGEAYMCTTPFGLPEFLHKSSIIFLQPTTVALLTPDGLNIRTTSFKYSRVEQIYFRIAKEIRLEFEKYLKVGRENAIDLYDIPFYTDWDKVWSKPLVDSNYVLENSRLKPVGPIIYEGLWSFYKEGRLKYELGTRTNSKGKETKIMKFWLEN